jgi:hypothetical protein
MALLYLAKVSASTERSNYSGVEYVIKDKVCGIHGPRAEKCDPHHKRAKGKEGKTEWTHRNMEKIWLLTVVMSQNRRARKWTKKMVQEWMSIHGFAMLWTALGMCCTSLCCTFLYVDSKEDIRKHPFFLWWGVFFGLGYDLQFWFPAFFSG